MTFASGLRSILRQDPDVIMVGEIRDSETAQIAVQAALTGHLVLSTLHTNDAPGAVSRLMEMHIEPYLVASVLLCSFAQRLVRKVCPIAPSPMIRPAPCSGFSGSRMRKGNLPARERRYHCGNTGYLGRIGIFEVMPVTAGNPGSHCPPGPRAGDFRHRPAAGRHEHPRSGRGPQGPRRDHHRRGSPPRRYGVGGPEESIGGGKPF